MSRLHRTATTLLALLLTTLGVGHPRNALAGSITPALQTQLNAAGSSDLIPVSFLMTSQLELSVLELTGLPREAKRTAVSTVDVTE